VRQPYVDAYSRELEVAGSSPATIARKLAAISSWYTFLIRQEITEKNPAKWAARPEIDKDTSNAVGLTEDELRRVIAVADADGLLASTIIRMLAFNGVRVGVITAATIGSLGHDRGHRIIKYRQKGGKEAKAPLTTDVTVPLDGYVAGRGQLAKSAPLFAAVAGHPLDESYVWRLVRSITRRAKVPAWEEISPHSLRHTFATLSLSMGIPLAEVQDAMGHKDPRTTQRYNRARFQLDNHPTYALAARVLPKAEPDEPEPREDGA
jgi:site-specific recombinase XerD